MCREKREVFFIYAMNQNTQIISLLDIQDMETINLHQDTKYETINVIHE